MDNTNEFEDYASARGLSLLIPPSPAEYSDRVTFEAWKAWQASREALAAENADLVAALERLFSSYKMLADSGDAGFWSLESLPEGMQAMEALAKRRGE